MSKDTCSVENCQRDSQSLGWCHAHYMRWRKTGDVRADVPLPPQKVREEPCSVEICNRPAEVLGWCLTHYMRKHTGSSFGDDVPIKTPLPRGEPCLFSECERLSICAGYCPGHNGQIRRKETLRPLRAPLPHGTRSLNNYGYVTVAMGDGTRRLEHQLVMEDLIGRPLMPEETIHHKNGVRDDNRPENLELWGGRHPKGQRIVDQVAWAREILETYESILPILDA